MQLTQEETAAIAVLAMGELQAIKVEELEGEPVDLKEVEILVSLVNKAGPEIGPDFQPITFADVEPLPEEGEEPDAPGERPFANG